MSRGLAIFGEGSLTFQEFTMKEPVPLAGISRETLLFHLHCSRRPAKYSSGTAGVVQW